MALDRKEDYKVQEHFTEDVIWAVNQEAYRVLMELKANPLGVQREPVRVGPAVDEYVKEQYIAPENKVPIVGVD